MIDYYDVVWGVLAGGRDGSKYLLLIDLKANWPQLRISV
jgi:hypothetical protein